MRRIELYLYIHRLPKRQPLDFSLDVRRLEDLPRICSGFLEVFPTLIMDGNHGLWLQRVEDFYCFFGIEREADRSHDRKACCTDMQDRCSDSKSLSDLTQAVEPDCI